MSNSLPLKLHIVSLDVPYPPDYGGMIDVFYKIKHLHQQGVELYLHCFAYGRAEQPNLAQYCKQVWYYKRQASYKSLSWQKPYMLYSRRHPDLLNNLLSNDAPILFEGVHTTYLLSHPLLKGRKKLLRNQNVEQEYFALLGKQELLPWRKLYYSVETHLLKQWENKLHAADAFLTVSLHDHQVFKQRYPHHIHEYIPSFQPFDEVVSAEGSGEFVLYHGNLAHIENVRALQWLAMHVFPLLTCRIIVAGRNPSLKLKKTLGAFPSLTLITNPSHDDMQQLMRQAHIHLLPTFQASGLKLKLLQSLYCGRHVVVNEPMLFGTGLDDLCHVANSGAAMVGLIEQLCKTPFTMQERAARQSALETHYSNTQNAKKIIALLA